MNLLSFLLKLPNRQARRLVVESKRKSIAHHSSEITNYLQVIAQSRYFDRRDLFDFYNALIGDYLTDHLPKVIRELQYPELKKDLDKLRAKREELVVEYNIWFFNQSTDF